jgi:SAM-dependent methyltransferase
LKAGEKRRTSFITEHIGDELIFDDECEFWRLASGRNIKYRSDSMVVTDLPGILRSASDLSSTSEELEREGRTWPASYYLSSRRSNVLRGFDWPRDSTVLEIGAGCGTITRFLAESFDRVVAIEGDELRARLASARLRDLDNVAVLCAPYDQVKFQSQFDFVFCIGVLEYAHLYNTAVEPFDEILRAIQSILTDRGALVLALENQFGLKYFAGAAEDHTGLRYDGIEGYLRSGPRGPRTLGRGQLRAKLLNADFQSPEFFYPFPDYKFARCIIKHELATRSDVDLSGLIGQEPGDYLNGTDDITFNVSEVWREVGQNGLVADLANSFLTVAPKSGQFAPLGCDWDAIAFSMAPRAKAYWTRTEFVRLGEKGARVHRRRLFPELNVSSSVKMREQYTEDWHDHPSLSAQFEGLLARPKCDLDDLASSLRPWLSWLGDQAGPDGLLDGALLDAIPRNLLVGDAGLIYVDRELSSSVPISLRYVVTRGLFLSLAPALTWARTPKILYRRGLGGVIVALARRMGLAEFGWSDIEAFCTEESRLQASVGIVADSPRVRFMRIMLAGLPCSPAAKSVRRFAGLWRPIAHRATRVLRR